MAMPVMIPAVAVPNRSVAVLVGMPVAGPASMHRSMFLGSLPHVPILRGLRP
jgi:hypothetical protein